MKHYKNFLVRFFVLFFAAALLIPPIPLAQAAISNGSNAVNVIGQTDPDAGNAITYTKKGANNGPYNDGFNYPAAVVLDSTGNRLFVADTSNDRVLVFNLNGSNQFVDRAADFVLGQTGFKTNSSATTQSGLSSPSDLSYDGANQRLFVADRDNNRIVVFDVTAITNGENAVNVLGQANFTSSSSGTAQNQLWGPRGVFYDNATQRLFVAEYGNNRVLVFDVTAISDGENAVNVLGQANFTTGTASTTQSTLNQPHEMCYDGTGRRLFLADMTNDRVMVFDVLTITNGENAVNVLGQTDFVTGTPATTQGRFYNPQGCAYDGTSNRLFVADGGNDRVMVFDVAAITDGENAVNVLGQVNFTSSSSTPIGQSTLNNPTSVFFDGGGNRLFVNDKSNQRLMIFDVAAITDGENATDSAGQIDGSGLPVYTKKGRNNGAKTTGFDDPHSMALDTVNHRLFVSDWLNQRVLVFNLNSSDQVVDYTADFVLGQTDFTSRVADTIQNSFQDPKGLVYDSANQRLFVADFNNDRILVFDVTAITNGENAVNVLGQTDFVTGTSGTTQAKLSTPEGLAYDSTNQRLFVGDSGNHRVIVYNLLDGITNGENAAFVLGQADFTSLVAAVTQSGMNNPKGVAYDATGNRLFVADSVNNRVMVFDVLTITNGENAVNVLGQTDFVTGTVGLTQSKLNDPRGIVFDSISNHVFVGDHDNKRALVFNAASISNGANAMTVFGQADFTSSSSAITQSKLSDTEAVAFNPTMGELLVADKGNNRVMVFNAIGTRPTTTVPTVSTQSANGLGTFNMNFQVNDTDDTGIQAKVEHSIDGGSTWRKSHLTGVTASAGLAPTLDNNASYQIGSVTHVDVSTGANTLNPVVWNSQSASNGGGSLDNLATNILMRAIPFDGLSEGTAGTSVSFALDNLDPSGLTALTSSLQTTTSVTLNWTAVTETNFNHYEIWYGTNQTDVLNRAGTAAEWDNVDMANMATRTTTSTVITPLAAGTAYYFKIWAIDNFGNEHTVTDLLTQSSGGSTVRLPTTSLAADVSLKVSLGSHRDLALVRMVSQLLGAERMIPARVSRAEEIGRIFPRAPQDIVDIVSNAVVRTLLLRWIQEDSTLRTLLRGQQTEHLIFEVWDVGKVGEPFTPVAKAENLRTNLFGEAQVILPSLKIQAYTFTIRKPYGLRQVLENVTLASPLELTFKQPVRTGDFNGDGVINLLDVQSFITNFKSRHENPGDYDLNEDGTLDLLDFVEVLPGLQ